jgi:hypothetical protein
VRSQQKLKLKQPLAKAIYTAAQSLPEQLQMLVQLELNVLSLDYRQAEEMTVEFDTTMTAQLKDMGEAREIVRSIQAERKKLGCALNARVMVTLPDWPESQESDIKRQTLADELIKGELLLVKVV